MIYVKCPYLILYCVIVEHFLRTSCYCGPLYAFSLFLFCCNKSVEKVFYCFNNIHILLIFCLICPEILRVSGMISNHGYGDIERLRHRSPSPMASSNFISGASLSAWNGLHHEVVIYLLFYFIIYVSFILVPLNLFFQWFFCT